MTYGAGGSTRQKTVELVQRIQNEIKIRSMAHLTCVGHTADEIGGILDDLWKVGIRNVLALRGDPPAGQTAFVATEGGFANADALAGYVRGRHDFCIGVAGYPEGHPQCLNKTRDLEYLKRKVDNGGNFVVTQLFFDNADFYRFRDDARAMGIKVADRGRHHADHECQPDQAIREHVRREDSASAADEAGIGGRPMPKRSTNTGSDYATMQCRDLLFNDVDGLHFYTLNKSKATVDIVKALGVEHAS